MELDRDVKSLLKQRQVFLQNKLINWITDEEVSIIN